MKLVTVLLLVCVVFLLCGFGIYENDKGGNLITEGIPKLFGQTSSHYADVSVDVREFAGMK